MQFNVRPFQLLILNTLPRLFKKKNNFSSKCKGLLLSLLSHYDLHTLKNNRGNIIKLLLLIVIFLKFKQLIH